MFRGSAVGRGLMTAYGFLVLTPPRAWRESHNYHHAHNGKLAGSQIGSYPVMTVAMWSQASLRERMLYRWARHPIGIACGYLTTFAFGMCVAPFLRSPRAHWGGPVALALHAVLLGATWRFVGTGVCLGVIVVPTAIATCVGSYLFYAQHNFPSVRLRDRREWTYVTAAMEYSSYMEAGPVWAWLTGNIGVHHVHHLNSLIPCYRLYEAMTAIPALRTPPNATLRPSDVLSCLRLHLWDPEAGRMVPYPGRAAP
jgi:omega-6 fatty acid desaturase (delta-12 desaturase)